MASQLYSFVGGKRGRWQVTKIAIVIGAPLETVQSVDVAAGNVTNLSDDVSWILRGATSYERYVNRNEQQSLTAIQAPLDRPEATCAALIPVRKSAAWWALPSDERRAIL